VPTLNIAITCWLIFAMAKKAGTPLRPRANTSSSTFRSNTLEVGRNAHQQKETPIFVIKALEAQIMDPPCGGKPEKTLRLGTRRYRSIMALHSKLEALAGDEPAAEILSEAKDLAGVSQSNGALLQRSLNPCSYNPSYNEPGTEACQNSSAVIPWLKPEAARNARSASTKKARCPRASASNSCLMEGTFEEFDKMVTHSCTDFGMEQNKVYGDGFVTGYGRIEGRLFLSLPKISPCLAGRFLRPMPARS